MLGCVSTASQALRRGEGGGEPNKLKGLAARTQEGKEKDFEPNEQLMRKTMSQLLGDGIPF